MLLARLGVGLLLGSGFALVVVGMLRRARARHDELMAWLTVEEEAQPADPTVEDAASWSDRISAVMGLLIGRFDTAGLIRHKLEAARVPLRIGELGVLVAAGAICSASVVILATGQWLLSLAPAACTPFVAAAVLERRIERRRRRFDEDLPAALTVIASSLGAGHTFLRSVQLVANEIDGPVADEFSTMLHEIELGSTLVAALERLHSRIEIESVQLLHDAVRVQAKSGGPMAELMHSLAGFLRQRHELDREVRVLTAEGKMSAVVLGALPPLLLVAMQATNPEYAAPLWRGWGLAVIGGSALSVAIGVASILRMSRIDV